MSFRFPNNKRPEELNVDESIGVVYDGDLVATITKKIRTVYVLKSQKAKYDFSSLAKAKEFVRAKYREVEDREKH